MRRDQQAMSRLGRLFIREVNLTIVGVIATTAVASGLHYVSVIHEMQRAREELCAAKLELVTIRNPYLRGVADAMDKCATLGALTGHSLPNWPQPLGALAELRMR
jgi:hypothetical protein